MNFISPLRSRNHLYMMVSVMVCFTIQAHSDIVNLRTGGKLEGRITSIEEGIVSINSVAAARSLKLKESFIKEAVFSHSEGIPLLLDRVSLKNGDLLPCRIEEFQSGQIIVKTFNDQDVTLPMNDISTLFFGSLEESTHIDGPQKLAPIKITPPPQVPSFLNEIPEKDAEQLSAIDNDLADLMDENAQPVLPSIEGWRGMNIARWVWRRDDNNRSSLEIPATRSIATKQMNMTDSFSLSGVYNGSGKKSNGPLANSINGTALIIGGSINLSVVNIPSSHFPQITGEDCYVLELFSQEILFYRIIAKENKKILLFRETINPSRNNQISDYEFTLKGEGREFEISIQNKASKRITDQIPHSIKYGSFTIANMETLPAIIKDLKLVSKNKIHATDIRTAISSFPPPEETTSLLVTIEGDILPGELMGFSEDGNQVEWQVQNEYHVPRLISKRFIAAISLSTEQNRSSSVRLFFDESGFLQSHGIRMNNESFHIDHPVLGFFEVPKINVRRMAVSTDQAKSNREEAIDE